MQNVQELLLVVGEIAKLQLGDRPRFGMVFPKALSSNANTWRPTWAGCCSRSATWSTCRRDRGASSRARSRRRGCRRACGSDALRGRADRKSRHVSYLPVPARSAENVAQALAPAVRVPAPIALECPSTVLALPAPVWIG
jgi:hypothetical protein